MRVAIATPPNKASANEKIMTARATGVTRWMISWEMEGNRREGKGHSPASNLASRILGDLTVTACEPDRVERETDQIIDYTHICVIVRTCANSGARINDVPQGSRLIYERTSGRRHSYCQILRRKKITFAPFLALTETHVRDRSADES